MQTAKSGRDAKIRTIHRTRATKQYEPNKHKALHGKDHTNRLHWADSFFWEINTSSAKTEIPRILRSPKIHYRALQNPPPCPYPVPDRSSPRPPYCVFKIHFNIILPSTPRSSTLPLSLRFPHQNRVCASPLPHTCHMPAHLIVLGLIKILLLLLN
jgi:hypothetical protein